MYLENLITEEMTLSAWGVSVRMTGFSSVCHMCWHLVLGSSDGQTMLGYLAMLYRHLGHVAFLPLPLPFRKTTSSVILMDSVCFLTRNFLY